MASDQETPEQPLGRPPHAPVRERSKRPGFGWLNSGNSSRSPSVSSEISEASSLSIGTGAATGTSSSYMNRSVIWDGYKHQKESVTAIVTNTLARAEEKLERSLKIDPSERQFDRKDLIMMDSENELFVSDADLETKLDDLQSELRDAEEAYRSSSDCQDMEQQLEAIVDNSPPVPEKDDVTTENGLGVDDGEGHLPVLPELSERSGSLFSSSELLRKDEPSSALEPVVESPTSLDKSSPTSVDTELTRTDVPASGDLQPPDLYGENQPLLSAATKDAQYITLPPSSSDRGNCQLIRGLLVVSVMVGCCAVAYFVWAGFGLDWL